MKPLLPSKGKSHSKIVLLEDEQLITDPLKVAEAFNDYFCEVAEFEGNRMDMEDFTGHPSIKSISEKEKMEQSFNFHTVNCGYIMEILDKLNPRKAVGCDNISQRLLRISAPAISQPLTTLINYFIEHCVWPAVWKCSDVSPIYKKSDETDKANYRPVSVLTALSKVYERVMFDQLYGPICYILSPNLSGYLKGHSCCTAVLKMVEDWRLSLNNREGVAAVAVDLSKAFDSVCHSLLLAKLKAYGLSDEAISLMSSYLRGRKQRVKLDNVYSQWRSVNTGLPQGSLLGPLLFNVYMNDLNYFVKDTSLRLYADDTTAYASDASPLVLEYLINSDLEIVSNWFQQNYLRVNVSKTQAMAVGPSLYRYDFHLDNTNVETTDSLKILGVTLDSKLSFKPHISEQLKRACAKAYALRRVRKFIPQTIMIRLYKAYILPHLEYCSPLLLGISDGLNNKLEDTNYYILRTILGLSKSTEYSHLLNIAHLQSLQSRRQFQALVLLYRCMNGQGPSYLSERFNVLNVNYDLRGGGTRLKLPPFNLEYQHKSFSYICARLWNGIPVKVREARDLPSFKRALRANMGQ